MSVEYFKIALRDDLILISSEKLLFGTYGKYENSYCRLQRKTKEKITYN